MAIVTLTPSTPLYLHSVLTGDLDEEIANPDTCHQYIHAAESSQNPVLALPGADYLGDVLEESS